MILLLGLGLVETRIAQDRTINECTASVAAEGHNRELILDGGGALGSRSSV